ncbi:MAG: ATP-binding cassette domain-containing protein [Acidiferrobacteraceae bacterium]|nr:ATP-binding cassette domain-containing protein [Acidiferrobacteraceae bacterium]
MLKITDLSLRRGSRLLLENVELDVYPGQRMGLTGANGSGKSSLFAVIAGRLDADQGKVTLPRGTLITEVLQETPNSTCTAIDYVIDGDQSFRSLELKIAQAELDDNGSLLATLHSQMDDIDGFRVSARAGQLLHGLGFTATEQSQSVDTFSGGWRMRLNLARALMTRADLLLLDEPTNHLDLDAMVWLERWLISYEGIVLVISHDREFLDRSVTRIAHIEDRTIQVYEGNYSLAEERRAASIEIQNKQHQRQQKKVRHMRSYIDRFRYKASKAKQAQSRLKALERLEIISPAQQENAFVFEFETPDHSPHQLVDLKGINAGYNEAILSNVNFRLTDGDRIGLLGRNGAGKTTLMKTLAAELPPLQGAYTGDSKLRIGYFAQQQLELLNPKWSPLDHLTDISHQQTDRSLRSFLGRFGFSGDAATEPVAIRSGGEKARLVLALIVYRKPNLLLLDEPTNHLDIQMRESISSALQSYHGCLIVVAHDRHLLRLVTDELWLIDDGTLRPFDGDLDDYVSWLRRRQKGTGKPIEDQTDERNKKGKELGLKAEQKIRPSKSTRQEKAKQRVKIKPLRDSLDRIEKEIDKATKVQQQLDQQLADPDIYNEANRSQLRELLFDQARNAQLHQELEGRWLEASELLEQADVPA